MEQKMKVKVTYLPALLLISLVALAQVTGDAPLDWRGLKPGMIRGQAVNILSALPNKPTLLGCEPTRVQGADVCTFMTADKFSLSFKDGKLIGITLIVDHKRFLPLVA